MHTGTANPFGIAAAQERGRMFIQNKDDVYRDMIIGVHQRPGDLHVRVPLRLLCGNRACVPCFVRR
jgi:predicted membrane GTPase involved in stress response